MKPWPWKTTPPVVEPRPDDQGMRKPRGAEDQANDPDAYFEDRLTRWNEFLDAEAPGSREAS